MWSRTTCRADTKTAPLGSLGAVRLKRPVITSSRRRARFSCLSLKSYSVIVPAFKSPLSSNAMCPDHTLVIGRRHRSQHLGRVDRIGALHCVDDDVHSVIRERRVDLHRRVETVFVLLGEVRSLVHLRKRQTCFRTDEVLHGASPASSATLSVHTPSPPRIFALMPSAVACLANGPPVASMPPYMITSGLGTLDLRQNRPEVAALSFVASRATTFTPRALAVFSNSSARPWP